MNKIKVLVADDHAVLRSGLRLLINSQKHMECVGEAANHEEALRKVFDLKPDVLVLDITMPCGTAAKVTEVLSREAPATHVVVLTMHDDPTYYRVALAAGAFGYVVKKSADTELLDAIRCAAKGQIYIAAELASKTGKADASVRGISSTHSRSLELLSERERLVLVMVAKGHTNQAIADQLDLSVKTIESYRARLMTKLGLQSRAEVTKLGIEAGLLEA